MFYKEGFGLITSHDRAGFSRLTHGEGFSYITATDCWKIVGWLDSGKHPDDYPNHVLTREICAAILIAYKEGLI